MFYTKLLNEITRNTQNDYALFDRHTISHGVMTTPINLFKWFWNDFITLVIWNMIARRVYWYAYTQTYTPITFWTIASFSLRFLIYFKVKKIRYHIFFMCVATSIWLYTVYASLNVLILQMHNLQDILRRSTTFMMFAESGLAISWIYFVSVCLLSIFIG